MGDVSARLVGGGLRIDANVRFRECKRANNRKTICSYYTCVNIVFRISSSLLNISIYFIQHNFIFFTQNIDINNLITYII